jgi:hypothetical protein
MSPSANVASFGRRRHISREPTRNAASEASIAATHTTSAEHHEDFARQAATDSDAPEPRNATAKRTFR